MNPRLFKLTAVAAAMFALSLWSSTLIRPPQAPAAAPGTYQVKECFDAWGWGTLPLRYGNRRFGYRHIAARHGWDPGMRRLIRRSLLYGYQEIEGDRVTFRRYRGSIAETVIVSRRGLPANQGSSVVGIITAYRARWDGETRRGSIPNGDGNLYPICSP